MTIKFASKTKELLDGLQRVRAFQPKQKKIFLSLSVELDLYADYMILTCTGAASTVRCNRTDQQRQKVSVPLDHFYRIVKSYANEEITVSFENNKMTCGNVTIGGIIIASVKDSGHEPSLKLPVNYKDRDLLKLRQQYSEQELGFNSLLLLVSQAEGRLVRKLAEAYSCLQEYGISKKDLLDLVNQRI